MASVRTGWDRLAGWTAVIGAVTALVLTPPFATAYFVAYPGNTLPFWYDDARPLLTRLLAFDSSEVVYATYGRIYNLVYLLFMPAAVVTHRAHASSASRLESAGHGLLMTGLVVTAIGVAGDYWGDGIGFAVEVLGLVVMVVGVTVWGLALARARVVPASWAWLMLLCGPAAIASTAIVGHLPSGPTTAFALVWLLVGLSMVSGRSPTATGAPAGPGARRGRVGAG